MYINKSGNYEVINKNAEGNFIKKILYHLALKNSAFAVRFLKYFQKFNIKIDENILHQLTSKHLDFADLVVHSPLVKKISDNDLVELAIKYPLLAADILMIKTSFINNYSIVDTHVSKIEFINKIIEREDLRDHLDNSKISEIACQHEFFADFLLESNEITILKSNEITKIALTHTNFALKLTENRGIFQELNGDDLTKISINHYRFAKICVNNHNNLKIENFTNVFERYENLAIMGLNLNLKADWTKVCLKHISVINNLHLNPVTFKGINPDRMLTFCETNELIAPTLLNIKQYNSFCYINYHKLAATSIYFVKQAYKNSLYYFQNENSCIHILHILIPYPALAIEILNDEKIKSVLIKDLSYHKIVDFDKFIDLYVINPIDALNKINKLDYYRLEEIAKLNCDVALSLLIQREVLTHLISQYPDILINLAIKFTKFTIELFKDEYKDLLQNKTCAYEIIALNNQEFANLLIKDITCTDIIYNFDKNYLLQIMMVNNEYVKLVASEERLISKFSGKNFDNDLYKIALDNEHFALSMVKYILSINAYNMINIAKKYVSVALELLNHKKLVSDLWENHIFELANIHQKFAVQMLKSYKICQKINSEYSKYLKLAKNDPEFAQNLFDHREYLQNIFQNNFELKKFLLMHPKFVVHFVEDLDKLDLLDIALINKNYARILFKEGSGIYNESASYGIREKLCELCAKYEFASINLLKYSNFIEILSNEEIVLIATEHKSFIHTFLDKNNLWEKIYGKQDLNISHEKLIFDLFIAKEICDEEGIVDLFYQQSFEREEGKLDELLPLIYYALNVNSENEDKIDQLMLNGFRQPELTREDIENALFSSVVPEILVEAA